MIVGRESLREIVKWHNLCIEYNVPSRFTPLVIGPSGSGKTYSIRNSISELGEDTLFIEIDATTLSAEGWKGLNLSEALAIHYDGSEESLKKIEKSIVYVDEIDKISMFGGETQQAAGRMTQTSLLKWLDKDSESCYISHRVGPTEVKIPISTQNITFIFSGAFQDLVEDEVSNKPIGFVKENLENKNNEIVWDKITKYGIIPEIVNRMNILIQVLPYSEEELKGIVRDDPSYLFARIALGVNIDKNKAARDCIKNNYGARGIAKYCWQEALKQSMEK